MTVGRLTAAAEARTARRAVAAVCGAGRFRAALDPDDRDELDAYAAECLARRRQWCDLADDITTAFGDSSVLWGTWSRHYRGKCSCGSAD